MAAAMAKRLNGKTILITGASSGIGKSTAFEFARTSPQNIKLILTARRIDSLNQIAADIAKEVGAGVQVLPVQLDISNADDVRTFVAKLPAEFKEVDVLVNNAYVSLVYTRLEDVLTQLAQTVASSKVSPKHPKSQKKIST